MAPEAHPEVLCAGIVVADAIASPVDVVPPRGAARGISGEDSVEALAL
jgi:hypothetical protein